MPTTECLCQSQGACQTYRLRDGRTVESRNGCLVDAATRHTVAGSDDAAYFLLTNARLSEDERYEIETKWRWVWPTLGRTKMSVGETLKNKT